MHCDYIGYRADDTDTPLSLSPPRGSVDRLRWSNFQYLGQYAAFSASCRNGRLLNELSRAVLKAPTPSSCGQVNLRPSETRVCDSFGQRSWGSGWIVVVLSFLPSSVDSRVAGLA